MNDPEIKSITDLQDDFNKYFTDPNFQKEYNEYLDWLEQEINSQEIPEDFVL
jgi:hypothetical protein